MNAPMTRLTMQTNQPLTITGMARPRKSGNRGAGEVKMSGRVCDCRSPVMVCVIANRHGIAAYCTALPIR